jgi:hypothetical protein
MCRVPTEMINWHHQARIPSHYTSWQSETAIFTSCIISLHSWLNWILKDIIAGPSIWENEDVFHYTWNAMPARGPWFAIKGEKSLADTVTTSAAFAHLDERLENDIPLMQSSASSVLVGTICYQEQHQAPSVRVKARNKRVYWSTISWVFEVPSCFQMSEVPEWVMIKSLSTLQTIKTKLKFSISPHGITHSRKQALQISWRQYSTCIQNKNSCMQYTR